MKIYVAAVLAILVIIVVLQNTFAVTPKLLFFETQMPLAVLLFVTLVIGYVLGILTAGKRKKKKA